MLHGDQHSGLQGGDPQDGLLDEGQHGGLLGGEEQLQGGDQGGRQQHGEDRQLGRDPVFLTGVTLPGTFPLGVRGIRAKGDPNI